MKTVLRVSSQKDLDRMVELEVVLDEPMERGTYVGVAEMLKELLSILTERDNES